MRVLISYKQFCLLYIQMQGQDAFRDRFRDYLTRRLDPNRAN